MTTTTQTPVFPRGALLGAAALILLTVVASAIVSLGGFATSTVPTATVVEQRALLFEDRTDGAVTVREVPDGRLVVVLPPGSDGFVRGVLRGLNRERKRESVSQETAFVLTRWSDGRLSLADPATNSSIELVSFGPTNLMAFARMLASEETER